MRTVLFALTLLTPLIAQADKTPTSKFNSKQLLPKDDSSLDPSFVAFRQQLIKIVGGKDVKGLKAIVAKDIKFSFGAEKDGVEGFLEEHSLDKKPQTSEFWSEMKAVLDGGGKFDPTESEENKRKEKAPLTRFTAPYVYTDWPSDFDAFEFVAVTVKDVSVLTSASAKAKTVEKVSYLIVKKIDEAKPVEGWTRVGLPSGQQGYIESRLVRSPIDYRAAFEKRKGQWKMVMFIAGD